MFLGGAALLLAGAASLLGPAGCLFPSYTFDEETTTTTSASSSSSGGGDTGGGGSSSTTTSGTGGTGGTGGGGPVELNCFDNTDDDEDGLIDCADPDCGSGYVCVDPAPVGWGQLGYLALYEGVQSPPQCPHGFDVNKFTGNSALDALPAQCSQCGCDKPTGQSCELTQDLDPQKNGLQPIQVKNVPCGQAATSLGTLTTPLPWSSAGGSCYQADTLPGATLCAGQPCNTSVLSSTPVVAGGLCTPTGGKPTLQPPKWGLNVRACQATEQGGGCTDGKVCRPRPLPPFAPKICVGKPGDVTCPEGYEKHLAYENVNDTRGCTPCTCGSPNGGSCEVTIHLYSDPQLNTCSTEVASFKAGTCFDLQGNPGLYGRTAEITTPPTGGACPSTGGGQPIGKVDPIQPTTICCPM